ncbi:MAG: peptide chain release factor 1 [Sedimentisphaerales bacterium]|nr:peptide chain release factor 1 [Sedimentisphaerales bacterium]
MADKLTVDQRVLAKLAEFDARFTELEQQMNDPAIAGDPNKIVAVAKEHGKLSGPAQAFRQYTALDRQLVDAQEMIDDDQTDPEMRQMAQEEIESLTSQRDQVLNDAKAKLVMSDDAGIDSVIMEIRSGTGGDEASLFVADLYGMYSRYIEKQNWKLEPMSFSSTELGGFREVIFSVKGKGVWQALGYEGGGHRVQRVPETEAQGRIHTSAATVAVLPEPEEIDIQISPDDVIEHVARSSGPGGQSVNKLNSAIKLEHIPTGITVSMQDEKSQHKNRAKAWRILRSRVYELEETKRREERSSARKTMIGSGDRSQRIRTYNFPQNRMTDHRINLSLYNLDKIIMGEMEELIQALVEYDKQLRLENL